MGKTSRLTFPQPSQFLHLSIVVVEPENAIWPGEELQHQEEDNDGWSQSAINHCEIILMKEVKCDCGWQCFILSWFLLLFSSRLFLDFLRNWWWNFCWTTMEKKRKEKKQIVMLLLGKVCGNVENCQIGNRSNDQIVLTIIGQRPLNTNHHESLARNYSTVNNNRVVYKRCWDENDKISSKNNLPKVLHKPYSIDLIQNGHQKMENQTKSQRKLENSVFLWKATEKLQQN